MSEDPLALETRRRLYSVVLRAQGLSGRDIQRAAGTAWGETSYHLGRLARSGLLIREKGSHRDFWFTALVPHGERLLLRQARSAATRRILVELASGGELTLPELSARCQLSLSRISVHMHRLLQTGVARSGKRQQLRTFSLADPARVARVLLEYREGFSDRVLDRLVDVWGELFPA